MHDQFVMHNMYAMHDLYAMYDQKVWLSDWVTQWLMGMILERFSPVKTFVDHELTPKGFSWFCNLDKEELFLYKIIFKLCK